MNTTVGNELIKYTEAFRRTARDVDDTTRNLFIKNPYFAKVWDKIVEVIAKFLPHVDSKNYSTTCVIDLHRESDKAALLDNYVTIFRNDCPQTEEVIKDYIALIQYSIPRSARFTNNLRGRSKARKEFFEQLEHLLKDHVSKHRTNTLAEEALEKVRLFRMDPGKNPLFPEMETETSVQSGLSKVPSGTRDDPDSMTITDTTLDLPDDSLNTPRSVMDHSVEQGSDTPQEVTPDPVLDGGSDVQLEEVEDEYHHDTIRVEQEGSVIFVERDD